MLSTNGDKIVHQRHRTTLSYCTPTYTTHTSSLSTLKYLLVSCTTHTSSLSTMKYLLVCATWLSHIHFALCPSVSTRGVYRGGGSGRSLHPVLLRGDFSPPHPVRWHCRLLSPVKWTNDTFIKPCQLLSQLSGYPNLAILYSVVCCLAVSSASAERALSKLQIVKNRLRSALCEDMLSALLVLASEKDLLGELSNSSIISRLSFANRSLKAHLQYA